MKLLRIGPLGAESPAVLDDSGHLFDLGVVTPDIDGAFLAEGGIDIARRALAAGRLPEIEPDGQRIGAPIARPGKVVCVGLNYMDHVEEIGSPTPRQPVVFLKAPYTVVGPYDNVLIPRGSAKTDCEVELAVVIGRTARYLEGTEEALDCVAGYAISNDVSEREFERDRSSQWDLGKSCETFNPLGPCLVPADEIGDPGTLGLRLSVNGQPRQSGHTKDMIFDVPFLIWYLSRHMLLEPGDVINTGTPAGVAMALPDTPYLRAGDVVEASIDGLGWQRQEVAQA